MPLPAKVGAKPGLVLNSSVLVKPPLATLLGWRAWVKGSAGRSCGSPGVIICPVPGWASGRPAGVVVAAGVSPGPVGASAGLKNRAYRKYPSTRIRIIKPTMIISFLYLKKKLFQDSG